MVADDRGQAYTLEGVLAAILVVTATLYGLQAIDTRAFQDETSSEIQQLKYRANDVLTLGAESGALRDAVVCYRENRPIDGDRDATLTEFEGMLNRTFDSQARQYQLSFTYSDGSSRVTEVVSRDADNADRQAPPTAAVATTTVTITDDTQVRTGDDCSPIPVTVSEAVKNPDDPDTLYLPDANPAPDANLYNIVGVRLIVW